MSEIQPENTKAQGEALRAAVLAAVPVGRQNAKGKADIQKAVGGDVNVIPVIIKLLEDGAIRRVGSRLTTLYYRE
ncbi:MAG: hypothetical protein NTV86_09515 [Planctomycetota bacterium]|nr:hypothetical protein [Planctomycetota bacterium]